VTTRFPRLFVDGTALFIASYGPSLVWATEADAPHPGVAAVPVVGALYVGGQLFTYAGHRGDCTSVGHSSLCTLSSAALGAGGALMIVDALAQATGIGMGFFGMVSRQHVGDPPIAHITAFGAAGGGGVAVAGRY